MFSRKCLSIGLVLLSLAIPAHGQETSDCTRYVDPTGSDENPGTQDQPWLTFHHAAEMAIAGDTVCLSAGIYAEADGVRFANSGTAEQPVIFKGLDTGAILHGSLELLPGTSYLRFDNLIVQDYSIWGVTLEGGNRDIAFSHMTITGGEAGIRMTYGDSGSDPLRGAVDGVILTDSRIGNTLYSAIDCTPGPCDNLTIQRVEVFCAGLYCDNAAEPFYGADAIAIERGQNILIEDCYIHDGAGDGIDLNSRDVGTEVQNIVVRRNRVENTATNGIKLWVTGEVSNNLIWKTGQDSLILGDQGGDFTVINNTIASRSGYGYLAVMGGYEVGAAAQVTLYNNIFYNDNPEMGGTLVYFSPGTTLTADHNLYYNPYRSDGVICAAFLGADVCFSHDQINGGEWFSQSGQDEHSLAVDPLFVDPANGDFHLAAGSPLIDAGLAAEGLPPEDLENNPRPAGSAPEVGAYERQ
jgi:hypothetical protein